MHVCECVTLLWDCLFSLGVCSSWMTAPKSDCRTSSSVFLSFFVLFLSRFWTHQSDAAIRQPVWHWLLFDPCWWVLWWFRLVSLCRRAHRMLLGWREKTVCSVNWKALGRSLFPLLRCPRDPFLPRWELLHNERMASRNQRFPFHRCLPLDCPLIHDSLLRIRMRSAFGFCLCSGSLLFCALCVCGYKNETGVLLFLPSPLSVRKRYCVLRG